jgi:tRNA (mo5U34)-methyltransferase
MDLTSFRPFLEHLTQTRLAPWVEPLSDAVRARLGPRAHGDLARWEAALAALPDCRPREPYSISPASASTPINHSRPRSPPVCARP